jgi:hypothetical protein
VLAGRFEQVGLVLSGDAGGGDKSGHLGRPPVSGLLV